MEKGYCSGFTFLRFHRVIQAAFGWEDYHLFAFKDEECQSNILIGLPSEDDFDFGIRMQNASKVKLSKVFTGNVRKLLYEYDFGDGWLHEIKLETVSDEKLKKSRLSFGQRQLPT